MLLEVPINRNLIRPITIIASLIIAACIILAALLFLLPENTAVSAVRAIFSTITMGSRQVQGAALLLDAGGDGVDPTLAVENRQLVEFPEDPRQDRQDAFFASILVPDRAGYILSWEQFIGESANNQSFTLGGSDRELFISLENVMRAYDNENGALLWEADLGDQVAKRCRGCFQTTPERVVALTLEQILYGLDRENGEVVWEYRLADDVSRSYRSGVWNTAVVGDNLLIMDDGELDGRVSRTLLVIDITTGNLQQQFTPTCPDSDGFFDDAPLSGDGLVLIDREQETITFIFGERINGPACVQRFAIAGALVAETRLLPDTEPARKMGGGLILLDTAHPYLAYAPDTLFLPLSSEDAAAGIFLIDLNGGQPNPQLIEPDYDLFPIAIDDNVLVLRAIKNRGTEGVELWGYDLQSGQLLWEHELEAEELFSGLSSGGDWAYRFSPQGLDIIQLFANPDRLLVQRVDIANGKLQYDVETRVGDAFWTGLTWSPQTAYLTLRGLYAVDLSDGETRLVWP